MEQLTNIHYGADGRVTYTITRVDNSGNTVAASVVKPSKSDLKSARRTRFRSAVHTGGSIFKIVFMFLLLLAVYRVLVNSAPITFSSFLEILGNLNHLCLSHLLKPSS